MRWEFWCVHGCFTNPRLVSLILKHMYCSLKDACCFFFFWPGDPSGFPARLTLEYSAFDM